MITTFFHGPHDHIQSPALQTGERGEGGGKGGDDNDLVSRGQHDHIRHGRRRIETGGRFRWGFCVSKFGVHGA